MKAHHKVILVGFSHTIHFRLKSSANYLVNHFQRLNEVKELKIFFFAQRANTRKQASSRRLLPCDALAPTVQNHAGVRCPVDTSALRTVDTSALRAEDQQLYNRTSLTSGAHRGSLSKRRELVLSSLPTPPPFFFADSRPPVSKVACLISLYLLSTCMYHTFSHITFLGYNHMITRASVFLNSLLSEHIIRCHMCPWGRLLPGCDTRFFPPERLLLSGQGGCSRRPYQG